MKNIGMNLVGTDLGFLFTNDVVSNLEKNNVQVVENNKKDEADFVKRMLKNLVSRAVDDYHCGRINNVDQLDKKYSEELEYLNKKINVDDCVIKMESGYIRVYWMGMQLCYLSLGNAKLRVNESGEGFIIWNILGRLTCWNKTGLCEKSCYNWRINQHFTKMRNLIFSKMDAFVPVMVKIFNTVNVYNKTFVRIHEDGDFYSMEYFQKWLQIADACPSVKFMAYTKDVKVLKRINEINHNGKNMVLRYSIMEDTNKKLIEKCVNESIPMFICMGTKPEKIQSNKERVVTEKLREQISPSPNYCIGDCGACKKCYDPNWMRIFTIMH